MRLPSIMTHPQYAFEFGYQQWNISLCLGQQYDFNTLIYD